MNLLTVGNKDYESIEHWHEMRLSQAIELYKVIDKCPEKLKEIYDEIVNQKDDIEKKVDKLQETIKRKEEIKTFPEFYGNVLKVISNIPQTIIDKILWTDRTAFYNLYCQKFVLGLMYFPYDYVTKEIGSFEFKGEIYHLPKSRFVLGQERPMGNSEAIEFTEAADLQLFSKDIDGGKYGCMANVISILCRPKGEKYDEETSLKRIESFNEITMDIIWEVFFYLIRQYNTYNRRILIYLNQLLSKQKGLPLKVVMNAGAGMEV